MRETHFYASDVRRRTGPWQWLRARPLLVDGSIAGIAAVLGLFGMRVTEYVGVPMREPDVWALLLNLAVALPLAVRRKYPLTVAVVIAVAYYVQGFAMYNSAAGGFTVLFATYTLGAHAKALPGLTIVLLEAIAAVGYIAYEPQMLSAVGLEPGLAFVALTVVQFPGVWVVGRAIRARQEYLTELEDRADRLERTAAAEVRAALAEERARVARELHDVVAHHVSVMTVQAAAARRTLQRDPDRSVEAMLAVEGTGRTALDEMRRIVGALRTADQSEQPGSDDDAATRSPRPGVAELEALVNRARDAGLRVELIVVGDARPLPSSVDLAVYRVTQEALTNTLKHAGPTTARVLLRYEPAAVSVTITDDGVGESPRRHRPDRGGKSDRPGHGLAGMRERVHLNGGTLHTGQRTIGGYEVSARLPFDPGAPESTRSTDNTDTDSADLADSTGTDRPEALPS